MASLQQLEEDVRQIKERNRSVETDKAWETSYVRRGLLIVFTYIAIGTYLYVIGASLPWLNAILAAVAFMLSTLTLPFFKKQWAKRIYKG